MIESYTKPILKSYKIPNVVFQTNEVKLVPHDMYNSIKSLQEHASDCSYIYYNGQERRNYIKSYYQEALGSYDKLIPLAYKADLFRYIRLYLEGGIYFDSSITPVDSSVKLMGDIIKHTDEFVSVYDRPVDSILNGFIASVPRHPILKKAIDMCIYNITNELYTDALKITGPTLLGKVAKSLGLLSKSNTIRYFTHPKEAGVITDNNKKLYYIYNNGYKENRNYFSKLPHYSKLFDEKKYMINHPLKLKKILKY
jgi:mannosyltransferase OCH1-like enzyme